MFGIERQASDATYEAFLDVTFLQEPFTPDSLARKVRQVLDAADSGRG